MQDKWIEEEAITERKKKKEKKKNNAGKALAESILLSVFNKCKKA